MISKTTIALKYYLEAFKFINDKGLWWSYAIPIVFNTILLGLFVYSASGLGSNTLNTLDTLITSYIPIPDSLAFIKELIQGFAYLFVLMASLMIYLFIFKYILFILLGPFFSYIGDLAHNRLIGEESKFSLKLFIRSIKVSLIVNLRLLILQSLWMILAYITMIIPILNLLSPFLLLIIEFYFSGASIINNNCERAQMSKSEITSFYKKNRAYLLGLGLGFWIIMLIPFIGWVIAPIIAVVASVLLFEKEKIYA